MTIAALAGWHATALTGWHATALTERFGEPVDVMGISGGGVTARRDQGIPRAEAASRAASALTRPRSNLVNFFTPVTPAAIEKFAR